MAAFFVATALSAQPRRTDPAARPKTSGAETEDPRRIQARDMARDALVLMHQERWGEAQALLARAYALVPAPTIALLDGRALEQMGQLVDALARFEIARSSVLDEASPRAFHDAVRDANAEYQRLVAKLPRLTIMVEGNGALRGSGVAVMLDGRELEAAALGKPIFVDPGDHVLSATVDGKVVAKSTVRLNEGQSERVALHVELPTSAPAPAPSPAPAQPGSDTILGFVALSAGAAGLTVGLVSGVLMLDAKESLDAVCHPTCPPESRADLDRFRTMRTISAAGYITGVIGLGIGAVVLFAPDRKAGPRQESRLEVLLSEREVTLRGRF
jgi:hypothetical protein